jgi:predicted transposase YbfD/YdcC
MGCQTAIAEQIRAHGGDYLLALKKNHKKAYAAIKAHFQQHIEHDLPWRNADNFFDAFDNAHGRRVRRRGWVMTGLGALPALEQWPGLQAVIAVETIRIAHKYAPVTSDYRFYLSSVVRSATAFVTMTRQHWEIETKLHWSLDVTFNEDRCRIRKDYAPENIAAVRHNALNLLRQEHVHQISLRRKRLLCSLDEHVCDHRGTKGYKPRYRREESRPCPHRSGDVSRRGLTDHLVRLEEQYRRDLQAQCPGWRLLRHRGRYPGTDVDASGRTPPRDYHGGLRGAVFLVPVTDTGTRRGRAVGEPTP